MNWKGILNWLVSGAAAGAAVFFASAFASGVPDATTLWSALAGAGAAMLNHLRENPLK